MAYESIGEAPGRRMRQPMMLAVAAVGAVCVVAAIALMGRVEGDATRASELLVSSDSIPPPSTAHQAPSPQILERRTRSLFVGCVARTMRGCSGAGSCSGGSTRPLAEGEMGDGRSFSVERGGGGPQLTFGHICLHGGASGRTPRDISLGPFVQDALLHNCRARGCLETRLFCC